MAVIPKIPTPSEAVNRSLIDRCYERGLPAPDTPEYDEYVDALAAHRDSVRGPVRARLKLLRENFEFPEARDGLDSTDLLDAARRKREAACRAYENGYKTFTLSEQIDAAAAQELAEGEFNILFAKYLDDQFGWRGDPFECYAYTHWRDIHRQVCAEVGKSLELWRLQNIQGEARKLHVAIDAALDRE